VKGGLTTRILLAFGVLASCVGGVFVALILTVVAERDVQRRADRSIENLAASTELERLVTDLETGERGYVITGHEEFLQPWSSARRAIPGRLNTLRHFAENSAQADRARDISDAVTSYLDDYSVPLVAAARRNNPSAKSLATTAEGRRRIDALRLEFDEFERAERELVARGHVRTEDASNRAIIAAAVGLGGSIIVIIVLTGYLSFAIVRPVRRAAAMAGALAGGDFSARVPETSTSEIGSLERSFNTMANGLEQNRDALRRLVDDQAALGRIATLVARGAPLDEIFVAAADEIGIRLNADSIAFLRYRADGTASLVAYRDHSADGHHPDRWLFEGGRVAPWSASRAPEAENESDQESAAASETPPDDARVRYTVAAPIIVEDRTWGTVVGTWRSSGSVPGDVDTGITQFSELVATAIANAEARSELQASRSRIVAAADDARRRIERDLHDGTQQRLVSLGLEVRAAQTRVPSDATELYERLGHIGDALAGVVEDLQEVSRGIHPVALSRGGLDAALRSLARRAALPVELDVQLDRRLPDMIEVALYYVVSEALTNAVKHARASVVQVTVRADDETVSLTVRDDGIGNADPARGSGLVGLRDRVEALGGRIDVTSPRDRGTTIAVSIPFGATPAPRRSSP
jgi:signal transduction histidine kinase